MKVFYSVSYLACNGYEIEKARFATRPQAEAFRAQFLKENARYRCYGYPVCGGRNHIAGRYEEDREANVHIREITPKEAVP